MTIRYAAICAGAVLAAIAMQGTSAQALTMTECSAKYKAAKDAGSLNGMKWNDFRKAQCASDAAAPTTASAPAPAPAPAAAPAPKPAAAAPAPAPAATGFAVYPHAVDSKFSSQKPHLARLHTCSEQWQANKANNGNGSMKWPQYYSECNKRLKGA
jgi:hypothetical protein